MILENIDTLKDQNDELFLEMNSIKQKQILLFNENVFLKKELENKEKILIKYKDISEKYRKQRKESKSELHSLQLVKSPISMLSNSNNTSVTILKKNFEKINISPFKTKEYDTFTSNRGRLTNVCSGILSFIQQIASLQQSISNRNGNVKDLKVEFESKKKQLINLAESYLADFKNNFKIENNQNFQILNFFKKGKK